MANIIPLASGTRIKLLGQEVDTWVAGLKLKSDLATIITYDRKHHCYRVRLDVPASLAKTRHRWRVLTHPPEAVTEVTEVLWEDDQLEVLSEVPDLHS